MHERIRDLLLRRLGRWVTTHAWLTLGVALLLAGGSVVITAMGLEFHTDRSGLVDPDIPWNRRYAEYRETFPRWDDAIVCLEGEPDDTRIDTLARQLADELAAAPGIAAADAGALSGPEQAALFRVADDEIFERTLAELSEGRRLAAAGNANQTLALATAGLQAEGRAGGEAALDRLEQLMGPYVAALEGGTPDFSWLDGTGDEVQWDQFTSPSGRIRFVLVHMGRPDKSVTMASVGARLTGLRQRIATLIETSDIPDVDWGITGVPAIEADETIQSIRDSTVASIAAFVLITILMIAVFRGIVVPLLAAGTVIVGVAWSFGWLMLTVGHLQLLSVIFTVILLGLGVAFAVYLVARLELVQHEHQDLPSAISRVFGGIGPGLLTGALTTAGAFAAIAFTDFKGMAEMGIIAGGGILLCLAATMTVFPAGLAVTRRWKSIIRHRAGGETAHFARGRLDSVDGHPLRTLVVSSGLVVALVLAALQVRYDPNVLNLHPPGIESVRWEKRIIEDGAISVWAGLYTVSPERAGPLADALRGLPEVSDVGGMGEFLRPDRDEREARITQVRDADPLTPAAAEGFAAMRGQVAAIRLGLAREAARLDDPPARLVSLIGRIEKTLSASATLPPAEQATRWESVQDAFTAGREDLEIMLARALRPGPVTAADLPPAAREQLVGRDGTWLLRVYPRRDPAGRSILHPERLGGFVAALRTVDEDVLGPPVQIYESSLLIVREYVKAAVYAVIVILVLLLLDFRSLVDALCALLPVTIGFVGAFAILGVTRTPLNFASIIGMPIIFGIGVDAGVHVVHRWRAEPRGCPAGLSGGTGRGITLTMLATMIGFGCMLLAEHRGIRSLGTVMVAGLGVTLIACYTTLPALLHLRPADPEGEAGGGEEVPAAQEIAAAEPRAVASSTTR